MTMTSALPDRWDMKAGLEPKVTQVGGVQVLQVVARAAVKQVTTGRLSLV